MNAFTAYLCRKIASIMMIEGSKQQQLTFDKGITNVPSDAICSDNTLQECIGMVYEDGEHRVIQKPVSFMTNVPVTILYVHKVAGQDNYIGYDATTQKIRWGTKDSDDVYQEGSYKSGDDCLYQYSGDDVPQVTSIGNTLVISTTEGLLYSPWQQQDDLNFIYKPLGDIPSLDIEFFLKGRDEGNDDKTVDSPARIDNYASAYQYDGVHWTLQKKDPYDDWIVGSYAKNKNKIAKKGCFCQPFFVVAAIELYDGTYTKITNPMLMLPNIESSLVLQYNSNSDMIYLTTTYCELYYRLKTDLSDWVDIVKGVTFFVTDGAEQYDITEVPQASETTLAVTTDGIFSNKYDHMLERSIVRTKTWTNTGSWVYFDMPIKKRNIKEVMFDITQLSVLYKIFETGLSYTVDEYNAVRPKESVLPNLTTQPRLDMVDFYTNTRLQSKNIMTYNSRLILSSINRSFYEGFHFFLPIANSTALIADDGHDYSFYVTIETDSGRKTVKHTVGNYRVMQGYYFFYPDTRAKKVAIYRDGYLLVERDLKESMGFGGAWYLPEALQKVQFPDEGSTDTDKPEPAYTSPTPESLPNVLMVSEVNNPFAFRAQGYYTLGTAEIIGISSLTQALSQGQFGQYPLIVFTAEGVWAMSVASTGYFADAHPMSREVCNNIRSITQTDGAIFFSSAKGLMIVVGNEVKCMSEQLSGKSSAPFMDFVKEAFIAYDYRDSLLWIFDKTNTTCWIYSIKSKTFAQYDFGKINNVDQIVTNVVNDYPDYLLQIGSKLYSLLERPNINADGNTVNNALVLNTYSAHMNPRPMKLENALALKTIFQIRHVSQFTPYTANGQTQKAAMTLRIFASNNLETWVELHSLGGTPWLYYQFQYDFANLIATDRFAGTVTITQERRTNKLR